MAAAVSSDDCGRPIGTLLGSHAGAEPAPRERPGLGKRGSPDWTPRGITALTRMLCGASSAASDAVTMLAAARAAPIAPLVAGAITAAYDDSSTIAPLRPPSIMARAHDRLRRSGAMTLTSKHRCHDGTGTSSNGPSPAF